MGASLDDRTRLVNPDGTVSPGTREVQVGGAAHP
jgi:hypothetical protein